MKLLPLILAMFFLGSTYADDRLALRAEIVSLAESFKGQTDPDGSKQKELESLIEKFMQGRANLTIGERAAKIAGNTWNQIWGPYAFDGTDNLPPGIDVNQIYQYVSEEGYYYNFAEYTLLGRTVRTFLRGNYEVLTDSIAVEFNKTGLLLEDLPYDTAGDLIENKEARVLNFPSFLPPVGIGGKLEEVYADDEIRINYGVIGDDLSTKALFVMRKVE